MVEKNPDLSGAVPGGLTPSQPKLPRLPCTKLNSFTIPCMEHSP